MVHLLACHFSGSDVILMLALYLAPYICVGLLAVGFLWAVGAALRERFEAKSRSRAEGFCVECGYDLRATPGRCPECGTPAKWVSAGQLMATEGAWESFASTGDVY